MSPSNNGNQPTYQLHPIGYVRASQGSFRLEILEPYRPALRELARFSHVMVFWWANKHDNAKHRAVTTTQLPYAPGVEAGVFACRSPYRPNPIAFSVVDMLGLERNVLRVRGLDAFDGTPVVDIKPYLSDLDCVKNSIRLE